jgi:hypothetical protein
MIINSVSKFIRDKKACGENIQVLKYEAELDNVNFAPPVAELRTKQANVLEDSVLKSRHVKIETEKSGFSYFLDGIERKRVLFNYNYIPVTYGYVSAAIMKRTDKKMHSAGIEKFVENIYLPYKQAADSPEIYFDIEDFKNYGLKPVNTGIKDLKTGEYPQYTVEFEQQAKSNIQDTRVKIERDLINEWIKKDFNDGYLFVDGRIENKNNEFYDYSSIVGIIKSHHVYFFSPQEQQKIYNLQKGERTSVFQPIDNGREENVYTWYLRLHKDNSNGKADFGIIRVEVPANDEILKKADEISSWILLETKPVAFPASRWDRMVYPIKYCEDYLKSKAPSWTMIESLS